MPFGINRPGDNDDEKNSGNNPRYAFEIAGKGGRVSIGHMPMITGTVVMTKRPRTLRPMYSSGTVDVSMKYRIEKLTINGRLMMAGKMMIAVIRDR